MNDLRLDAVRVLTEREELPNAELFQHRLVMSSPAGYDKKSWAFWSSRLPQAGNLFSLEQMGVSERYDYIMIFPEKDKDAASIEIALGLNSVTPNGYVVAVAENDAGGKRLAELFGLFGIHVDVHSKHHCRIAVATMNGQKADTGKIARVISGGSVPQLRPHGFYTLPGLHGPDAIDVGSALLVRELPRHIGGRVADFGCGWGYLTVNILARAEELDQLYAVDLDGRAFACVHKNVAQHVPQNHEKMVPVWADLSVPNKDIPGKLDMVVMNPPFHTGRTHVPELGRAMIAQAAASLKPGGTLWVVANRHLPYEQTLGSLFVRVDLRAEENGFKVYLATKA